MTRPAFSESYFSFLLSGRAEDFRVASAAFQEAVESGVSLSDLQNYMDESHQSAELLCVLMDNGFVDNTE